MIQHWLKEVLRTTIPDTKFTADYEPEKTATYGTVFYEGGGDPARYDAKYRYPRYMVWVESDDWGLAEFIAQQVFDSLHEYDLKSGREEIVVEYRNRNDEIIGTDTIVLHKITAAGEVNRIGVIEGKMTYSVNFETTISKKE